MALTEQEIKTLSSIAMQLRDEGAEKQIIALALSLAKGQYRNAEEDHLGAMMLMAGAFAAMMMDAPNRPTCCVLHEADFIRSQLSAIAAQYSRVREERQIKGCNDGNTKPH